MSFVVVGIVHGLCVFIHVCTNHFCVDGIKSSAVSVKRAAEFRNNMHPIYYSVEMIKPVGSNQWIAVFKMVSVGVTVSMGATVSVEEGVLGSFSQDANEKASTARVPSTAKSVMAVNVLRINLMFLVNILFFIIVAEDGVYLGGVAGVEDGECLGVAGDGEDFGIGGVAADDLRIVVAVDLTGENGTGGNILYGFDNVGEGKVVADAPHRLLVPPHEGIVVLVALSAILLHLFFPQDVSVAPEDASYNIKRKWWAKSYMRGEIFLKSFRFGCNI